jgi:small subunit ribosomal protein S18
MADEPITSEENVKETNTSEGSSDTESKSSDRGSRSRGPRQNYRGNRSQQSRSSYQNRRRYSRRKVCAFCADKNLTIDWKRTDGLRRYVADSGAIQPRRKSGLCAKHQRRVAVAIKRARHIALLPYTTEHVRIMGKNY